MKKGILIESCEMGLLIDNRHLIDYDDAKNVLSDYFFEDYWLDNHFLDEIDTFSPQNIFVRYSSCAPFPCAIDAKDYAFSLNPKYIAGYIKNRVLNDLAYILLLPNDIQEEFSDIESIMSFSACHKTDKYNILDKINHMLCLCNEVFLEENEEKAKGLLKPLANVFNNYFEKDIQDLTGWNFTLEIYYGVNELKDVVAQEIFIPDKRKEFCELISKNNWNFDEKIKILECIFL